MKLNKKTTMTIPRIATIATRREYQLFIVFHFILPFRFPPLDFNFGASFNKIIPIETPKCRKRKVIVKEKKMQCLFFS
jgi:hypothetical protein